jgi:glycosyltransferase involved in cell wall biosynthesis
MRLTKVGFRQFEGIEKCDMRVGIDAHCLGQQKTGNETYTFNLVKHLASLERSGIEYTVYVHRRWQADEEIFSDGFRCKEIRPVNPLIRIPIGFAIQSRVENVDVFHAQYLLPHHLRCRTVVTVHDVLYERFPEYFTKWDCYRHRIGVRWSCGRANHIITVSQSSKRDLVELYGLDPSNISVIYPGPDACYRPLARDEARERLRERYGIEEDFILYVGAIQPRKNIPKLLSAFARVKCEHKVPHKLVIVGPKSWLAENTFLSLEGNPAKNDILLTGYVPREDLPWFYNASTIFVYVSMCEGFGLPVVEAMACGTPTITSRGSSLEEIAGKAAILVDPKDEEAIANAINQALFDSELQATFRQLGIARSKEFSCSKMAFETQEIYRRLTS